ncbi:hypothetical protein L218DRAFT_1002016 [Marasmius fiardii PR-910]|nr:hypothetical protein L218DRAFT_1002016 [Marasmius fiardii PR-910]
MATPLYPSITYPAGKFVFCAGSILFRRARITSTTSLPDVTEAYEDSQQDSPKWKWQICLLYHCLKNQWLLPKGRKEAGESLATAAMRETFEETGYPNALLPITLPTRAPIPGTNQKDVIRIADKCSTEPITVTLRDVRTAPLIWDAESTETSHTELLSKISSHDQNQDRFPNAKFIHWYITIVQSQAQFDVVSESLETNGEVDLEFDSASAELGDAEKQENTQTASESFNSHFFDIDSVGDDVGAAERLTFQGDRDVARLAIELVKGTYGD